MGPPPVLSEDEENALQSNGQLTATEQGLHGGRWVYCRLLKNFQLRTRRKHFLKIMCLETDGFKQSFAIISCPLSLVKV